MTDAAFGRDLVATAPAAPTWPIGARVRAYLEGARGAYSDNTERAIRGDMERFTAWCRPRGLCELPASTTTMVTYIEATTRTHAPATVRRYVSSVATVHKALGVANPLDDPTVKLALRRMHRSKGRRQTQVMGLTWALRQRLLAASGDRLIDARNRAILAVSYDTLVRRSELVALQVPDLMVEIDDSAALLVSRSKTDGEGEGALQYLHGDSVELVQAWLRGSGIATGALFRSVRKDGTVGGRLDGTQIPRIYKAMARRAGLPGEVVKRLSGHSPRVGAVQDMIASGIAMAAILQAGRWKSTSMVHRYGERLLAQRSAAAQLARLQERK